jgi:hypothetical protein
MSGLKASKLGMSSGQKTLLLVLNGLTNHLLQNIGSYLKIPDLDPKQLINGKID